MKSIVLALFFALTATVSSRAITIPTVSIGDLGNPNDPATGYGGVNYAYSIGKYEVTVGQYAAFLNAVAATDTYTLYSPPMAADLNTSGIARSGPPGSYTYNVIGSANHPITYVSWGDAARFANWLNNGQPTGAQNSGTTEDGAYTLNGATTAFDLNLVSRNSNAKWFIPTENEWYKAAYYQPVAKGGDSDSYWAYPMKTNSLPYSDQPPGVTPDNTRTGNFYQDDGLANGYDDGFAVTGSSSYSNIPNYLTDGGAYTTSSSYYGTLDQGGNAWEWNEAAINALSRGIRGSSWNNDSSGLLASNRNDYNSGDATATVGFRVGTLAVPEPGAIAICAIGMVWIASFQHRPTSHNRS